jgi:glucose/arabinose dehydrogenase
MRRSNSLRSRIASGFTACALILGLATFADAQRGGTDTLGDGPWIYETYERGMPPVRVSVVTKGLSHPWGMVFLPNGDMLITERDAKRIRILRNGTLDPEPVPGMPDLGIDKLFDIALHPDFENNRFVYFTYIKSGTRPDGSEGYWATTAVARGTFDGARLTGVDDVFVADAAWAPLGGGDGIRMTFAPDGTMLVSSSHRRDLEAPQNTESQIGKILRLNADGGVPADNPFVGEQGYLPEIYSIGHRTVLGLAVHPQTGQIWETENGPQGGDEVNILEPGGNFGWPVATYGRDYDGTLVSPTPRPEGMVPPVVFWVPSITTSGIAIYDGDAFPAWQGNLFVGSMTTGRIPGTGHIERVVFAENGGELRREVMLDDLDQRVRDIRQGPDDLIYILTDENQAALLKMEPVAE